MTFEVQIIGLKGRARAPCARSAHAAPYILMNNKLNFNSNYLLDAAINVLSKQDNL